MYNFQSNYPSGGGFQQGWGGGPPPPPGGYGGGPAYPGGYGGGGYGGAYNVNSSPYGGYSAYGGYQTGSAPPPGGQHGYTGGGYTSGYGGFQGGFQAVQNCQNMYAGHQQVAPPPAPPSVYQHGINQQMAQMHQQMQQMMRMQVEQQMGIKRKPKKKKKKRRNEDEEEEEEEEEEEPEEEIDEDKEAEIKQRVKNIYIDELMRRLDRSGTLDVTSGTIQGYPVYLEGDPVLTVNHEEFNYSDAAGQEWDPEMDCVYLRKALKGWGTNEDAIIHVVTTRNNTQRQELKKVYKTSYGRDLIEDLAGDLSFNFKEAVLAMFVEPATYDAYCIKEAIYGPGTDERALMEILLTRTNPQIKAIRAVYNEVVSPNAKKASDKIEQDIEGDTSGDFKRLLISASQGNRSHISRKKLEAAVEEQVIDGTPTGMYEVNFDKLCDMRKAEADAQNLFKAGEDKWGTDEETFVRIFANRDYYQLKATYNEYVKITQRDIENSISRETSGDFERGLLSIVKNIKYRPRFFAEELTSAMKGLGTNDKRLIRIIVSRSEIDMVQIKKHFLEKNKKTLWRWLKEDCSGDYLKLLQAIVGKD